MAPSKSSGKKYTTYLVVLVIVFLLYITTISALPINLIPAGYDGFKNLLTRSGEGMSKGEVAGAAVGGVSGMFVLVGLAACCFARGMR